MEGQVVDVAHFFKGLGGNLPPISSSNGTPAASPAAAPKVHDFSSSSLMLLDESQAVDALQQSDIAKYPSPRPTRPTGTCFVTSEDLIAYAVKGASVRVIHKRSGSRTLLKGHSEPITDMAFAGSCLATTGEDGLCIVWEVRPTGGEEDESKAELEAHETLRLRVPPGECAQRVLFHPTMGLTVFIAHNSSLTAVALNKSTWEIYTNQPEPEVGVLVDQVAVMKFVGHSQTINDVSFDVAGERMVTGADDGMMMTWSAKVGGDIERRPISTMPLAQPVVFARFCDGAVACGFSNHEELCLVKSNQVISRVRFASAKSGGAIRFRAQSIASGRHIVLADSASPCAVLVQVSESRFERAVLLKVPAEVFSFSLSETGEDAVDINAVGESMIQVFELSSISGVLPASGGSGVVPQLDDPREVPASPPPPPPPMAMTTARNSTSAGAVSGDVAVMESTIDAKINALMAKLENDRIAQQEVESQRHKRLLETVSNSITVALPSIVENAVAAKLESPQFSASITAAVKAGIDSSLGKEIKNNVDKSLKSTMPSLLEKVSESTASQLAGKIQQPLAKAFEEAFKSKLVPAFEHGVSEMLNQLESHMSKRGDVGQGEPQEPPEERVRQSIDSGDFPQAVTIALSCNEQTLLTDTCDQIDLGRLLLSPDHGFPQTVLMRLLEGLATNVESEPVKRLEWVEGVALALDPKSAEIEETLPKVARSARDSLTKQTKLYASLGKNATRFKAVLHILVSLGGHS